MRNRHILPEDRSRRAGDLASSMIPIGLLLPLEEVGAAVPAIKDVNLKWARKPTFEKAAN